MEGPPRSRAHFPLVSKHPPMRVCVFSLSVARLPHVLACLALRHASRARLLADAHACFSPIPCSALAAAGRHVCGLVMSCDWGHGFLQVLGRLCVRRLTLPYPNPGMPCRCSSAWASRAPAWPGRPSRRPASSSSTTGARPRTPRSGLVSVWCGPMQARAILSRRWRAPMQAWAVLSRDWRACHSCCWAGCPGLGACVSVLPPAAPRLFRGTGQGAGRICSAPQGLPCAPPGQAAGVAA